ncbi:MAG: 6-phosphofructokinase [Oscillospiraceae bacterium]|jgi:6-phosphofructokinase 1|nr:6-phosphofructokinase [Oscillospiraceae bacterium]
MGVQRIGLLTSGGDAPGMNAAVRAVVRTAFVNGIEVLGIRRGYNGLIHGDVFEMEHKTVNGLTGRGGTILYTARSPEFATDEGVQRAAKTCKFLGIDAIICVGGDGTFRGARDLSKYNIPAVGIPATIDNDIACTNYTIGFDTACNTAIDAIDKLRDTMQSHERCSLVEVMGRNAGHLAAYVGIAVGANVILVPERPYDFHNDVIEKMRRSRIHGHNHFIVIVAEGVAEKEGDSHQIARNIADEIGLDVRVTILGHIQRGGQPNARDRVTASRMGRHAVEILRDGKINRVIGIQDGVLQDFDIDEALLMEKDLQETMYDTARILSLS